jgi:hypothetical protein
MIVDGARPKRRAIARMDSFLATPSWISSRSAKVSRGRQRGAVSSPNLGLTPPASANHPQPVRIDTPTATPASLADIPSLMKSQNRRRTNGDNNAGTTTSD